MVIELVGTINPGNMKANTTRKPRKRKGFHSAALDTLVRPGGWDEDGMGVGDGRWGTGMGMKVGEAYCFEHWSHITSGIASGLV